MQLAAEQWPGDFDAERTLRKLGKKNKNGKNNNPCSSESFDSSVCLALLWACPLHSFLYLYLAGIQLTLSSKANND